MHSPHKYYWRFYTAFFCMVFSLSSQAGPDADPQAINSKISKYLEQAIDLNNDLSFLQQLLLVLKLQPSYTVASEPRIGTNCWNEWTATTSAQAGFLSKIAEELHKTITTARESLTPDTRESMVRLQEILYRAQNQIGTKCAIITNSQQQLASARSFLTDLVRRKQEDYKMRREKMLQFLRAGNGFFMQDEMRAELDLLLPQVESTQAQITELRRQLSTLQAEKVKAEQAKQNVLSQKDSMEKSLQSFKANLDTQRNAAQIAHNDTLARLKQEHQDLLAKQKAELDALAKQLAATKQKGSDDAAIQKRELLRLQQESQNLEAQQKQLLESIRELHAQKVQLIVSACQITAGEIEAGAAALMDRKEKPEVVFSLSTNFATATQYFRFQEHFKELLRMHVRVERGSASPTILLNDILWDEDNSKVSFSLAIRTRINAVLCDYGDTKRFHIRLLDNGSFADAGAIKKIADVINQLMRDSENYTEQATQVSAAFYETRAVQLSQQSIAGAAMATHTAQ